MVLPAPVAADPVFTTTFVLPVAGNPGVVTTRRNGPVTRMVDIGAIGPHPLAFDPYVGRRRPNGVYVDRNDWPDADVEPLGVRLIGGSKSKTER
jgi:hypothetical protein